MSIEIYIELAIDLDCLSDTHMNAGNNIMNVFNLKIEVFKKAEAFFAKHLGKV